MTAAVGSVWAGERLLRRSGRPDAPLSVDYRLVALGGLIPDLIDKPLARSGIDALSYSQTAGHTIGHTLVLALALIVAGAILARGGDPRLLSLGLGDLTHLLIDPVIVYPGVLAWPLFGSEFPKSDGIPSPYLRAFDLLLVATALLLVYRRREGFQQWMGRFAATGRVESATGRPRGFLTGVGRGRDTLVRA